MCYDAIWQAVKAELSGDKAKEYVARIWEHARWNSFDKMQQTASEIAAIMREIGMEEVEVIQYPADGVTAFGGWVMPEAWDVEEATLEIAEPSVPDPLLANYQECPQALMMYSAATPPEGVVAEVVAVDKAGNAASYEGLDVRGKILLVDSPWIDTGMLAFERGALGIVSDAMKLAGSPQDKGGGFLDNAMQWNNYAVPLWRTEKKGFGFSLSPAGGRRLRELLRTHPSVRLRAAVRTRRYAGTLPLVTGLLRGETSEEIAITGHLCEPGANDNSSGCGLGLEVVRTVRALRDQGKLPGLRRGLRPVFSFEVRGYQAFLASYRHLRRFVAGINLDMVGSDLSDARAVANLIYNWPNLPACTDFLALELMRRAQREDALFRFRTHEGGGLVDNLFGEPSVGAPMCVLGAWPDACYHTSLDRVETISPKGLALFGRVAATYCAFLANAGLPEAVWLARLTAAHAEEELARAAQSGADSALTHLARRNVERLRSIGRLVRSRGVMPTQSGLDANKDWLCSWSHLFKDEELRDHLEKLGKRLLDSAGRRERALRADRRYGERAGVAPKERKTRGAEGPSEDDERRARRLVPLRTFKGSLCFESLDEAARAELKERTGLTVGWGAPHWLQLALFQSNGKRTAWDIYGWLKGEGGGTDLPTLANTLEFLAKHGFVRLRPVLGKEDYLAALGAVGVTRGQVLMVHSSLSQFGYVEGGAETVIDALLEAIGPEGTLAMPTLSCSWVGRPPYDPRTTPSRVGAITEAFRRRPGVVRSGHPTHSVAAMGPKAGEIVREHTPERPVFAPESPYGKLYDLDACVLMLAKLAANTSLHMAEERAGVPLVDIVGHIVEDGRRREVVIHRAPWHANFDEHYKVLTERGLIRAAPLGEGTIHLMRVRDAVDAALENIRRNPRLVMGEGCQCDFCRRFRAQLG